jgi:hypothetical protein
MLKPFVCHIGSFPGEHTSLSILQMFKVNLWHRMPGFAHILEITCENLRLQLLSLSLECAQVIQILCVMPGARDTTWSVAYDETLSHIFSSFRCFTFQGFHRTAEPSLAVAEPHGFPFSST